MVLSVLLWLLLTLVVVLVALVALPVRLRLTARSEPVAFVKVELRLLGRALPWLVLVDSSQPGRMRTKPASKAKPKARKTKRKRAGGASRETMGRMLRAGPDLVFGLLRQIRIERFLLTVRFGLDDPAETGQLFGMLAPIAQAPQWMLGPPVSVSLTPVFDRPCAAGEADIVLSLRPVRLVPPAARFAWRAFGPVK
ncbi:MAG: DUF2953 domain-containing protein [Rhodobacter sp.]|nr:DUF2953 domain-containing protein [Rhodobacter sp.]